MVSRTLVTAVLALAATACVSAGAADSAPAAVAAAAPGAKLAPSPAAAPKAAATVCPTAGFSCSTYFEEVAPLTPAEAAAVEARAEPGQLSNGALPWNTVEPCPTDALTGRTAAQIEAQVRGFGGGLKCWNFWLRGAED